MLMKLDPTPYGSGQAPKPQPCPDNTGLTFTIVDWLFRIDVIRIPFQTFTLNSGRLELKQVYMKAIGTVLASMA